jgi:hypothetical protein
MGDSTDGLGFARPFNGDEHRVAVYPTYGAVGQGRRSGPGLLFASLRQDRVHLLDNMRVVTPKRRGEFDATRRASGPAAAGAGPC